MGRYIQKVQLIIFVFVHVHALQRWLNELLVWDSEKFGGLEEIVVPPSKVWLPSFTLDNT